MSDFLDLRKFTKQAKIGQGSFGQVFKIIEIDTETIFSAKISLTIFNENDKKFILNLRREVTILSQLNHPSILKFIGYSPFDFNHNSYPVIVTEYSPNGSLADIIELEHKSIPLSTWTDTKKLINIYGIASAMSYLHSHNIIHRDLKPANILEDENLFPKIADFGLSKIYHQNIDSMTSQSTIGFKGTPIYIAPEIWTDCNYSKSGDVYSFAFIFYELFTNIEPFKNYDLNMLHKKVIRDGERPKFIYAIANCYQNLIERCWSSNPEARPTFDEIAYELRTNNEFITDTIDKDEFFDYIESFDGIICTYDPNKQLETIISTEEDFESSEKKSEEESDESSGKVIEEMITTEDKNEENSFDTNKKIKTILPTRTNNEDIITIGEFNIISLNSQKQVISNIIENKSTLNKFKGFLEFLEYFERFNPEPKIQYFYIPTKNTGTTVEYFFQQKSTIALSYQLIELINEHKLFESPEFHNLLKSFNKLLIDLKYPTNSFDSIYTQVLNLKEKNNDHLRINIIINSLNKTDMKFRNDENIYSVIIGNDVVEITGQNAGFKNTGGGTFYGCSSLKRITISSSITSIGSYSLCVCSSLTKVSIPSSVKFIGKGSFSGCSSLINILIPSSIISIEPFAFCGCISLSEISFAKPFSLVEIKEHAFCECSSLTTISIPSSVMKVENYAFSECPLLNKIFIPSSAKIGEYVFNKCEMITLLNGMEIINSQLFYGSSLLTKITIPSSVTSIKKSAFDICSKLTQVIIPNSVTKIGKSAFNMCSSLKQVSISTSVIEIKEMAFGFCESLKNITIPSSVKLIDKFAFYHCSLLTQISFEIPSSLISLGESAFNYCKSLYQISIPSSLMSIEENIFYECSSLSQILFEIPSSVASIGESAFYNCISLKNVSIPSSVAKIDVDAFCFCESLEQVTIPSSVIEIGKSAFRGCKLLKAITIPPSLTKIDEDTFSYCEALEQISIPSSVTEIGKYSFAYCSSLKYVSILSSITKICEFAFKQCTALVEISIPSYTQIDEHAFDGCTNHKILIYSENNII
ncbi:hypothetical protein M9Y10_036546 [Tritrichomonas musculus]|uniref:Protein kinase domain-containing protein n=1 Tax=Tritrichomonas musculus TaxID=1915356 RepID=A0ABR2GV58_9EUKA